MRWLDEAQFAAGFREAAVTTRRLQRALEGLAATPLHFDLIRMGTIELAASGTLGTAEIAATGPGSFAITVSASAAFTVSLGVRTQFGAELAIRLSARPRYAEPLLLVIDIAPIRADDVVIATRSSGLAAMIPGLIDTVLHEARGIVADQMCALLNTEALRSSRVIDIGARLEPDGRTAATPIPPQWRWLSDEQFGHRFLHRAVTVGRLSSGFDDLAQTVVDIGPLTVGPRGLAAVQASGFVASPTVQPHRDEKGPTFDVAVPLRLELSVTVGSRMDYTVDVGIPLTATARYAEPLAVVVDIAEVAAGAIQVHVKARTAAGRVIAMLVGLDRRLRRHIAQVVNERIADAAQRTVDVGARIEAAG